MLTCAIATTSANEQGFASEVAGAAFLHVSAKRALVTQEPSYMNELSQASIDTLAEQGGPLSEEELAEFLAVPGAEVALRLRRYERREAPPHYRPHAVI